MFFSVPPSPGFNRNSPNLRSFGKKGPRDRGDENGDQSPVPAPKKAFVEPALPEKGLKAKKGSVKLGAGLQYVEVAVEKVPLSPPQTSVGENQTNNKTQYAEVLLPSNVTVQEVEECEEIPQLPNKNYKKLSSSSNDPDDIWVRKPPAHPPPSLPPKTRTKSDADRRAAKTGRPPALLPPDPEPAGPVNPEGQSAPTVSDQATKRVATPELSRKGYEDMSLASESGGRETPPAEDIWKPQPVNMREHTRQQPLPYENVSLPHTRQPPPPSGMNSMLISDVDRQGEGDDGYVVVNQQPLKPPDARGYENITPGAATQGAVTPGAASSATKRTPYENVNDGYYVPMIGGISPALKQTDRMSNQTPAEDDKDKNLSDDEGIKLTYN